ncbi:MAG: tetratricopeptide repeat protein, partial [Caldilineaceae bacterium]|nr:tetratricopeptide repeat protein [Caldilineaceae bacterium]
DQVEVEHDNLRAALDWSYADGEFEPGLRMVAALWEFWMNRGLANEGQMQAARFLARPEAADPTYTRAMALHTAGVCAFYQGLYQTALAWVAEGRAISRNLGPSGRYPLALALIPQGYSILALKDLDEAQSVGEEILRLGRELENTFVQGHALNMLGTIDRLRGEGKKAVERFLESFICFQAHGNGVMHGVALMNVGKMLCEQGEYVAAHTYLTRSLAIFEELNDKVRHSSALRDLSILALALGDLNEAHVLLATALTLAHQTGHTREHIRVCEFMGRVAQWKGDYARATSLHRESLTLCLESNCHEYIPVVIEAFACLAAAQAQVERAATLFGIAEAPFAATPPPWDLLILLYEPNLRAQHERLLAQTQTVLGEIAFAAAWATGAAMGRVQSVAYALEDVPTTISPKMSMS